MTRTIHPIALHLESRACLLVGTGEELEGRAQTLLAAGAQLQIVSTDPHANLLALANHPNLTTLQREFVDSDLDGKWLAVLVGGDPILSARVAQAAEARQIFFCAVDLPKFSSFSHMALAREGALTIAISTCGEAPSLGRRLREEISRLMREANLANFVAELSELRRQTSAENRRKVLGEAVRSLRFTGEILLPAKRK